LSEAAKHTVKTAPGIGKEATRIFASSPFSSSASLKRDNGTKGFEKFGELCFNNETMKKYLSANVFEEVLKAQKEKSPLEPELIDEVANAVHEWGKSHGTFLNV
jgi:glutamine synthetase type III